MVMKIQDKKVSGSLKELDYKAELALWDLLYKANQILYLSVPIA